MLRGRPEERYKFALGLLAGIVVALPLNVLNLTSRIHSPRFGYLLVAVFIGAVVFRKRGFVFGTCSTILLISLPQAIASLLPTPLTNWHVSAGVLWLIALSTIGCLYIVREAETRTDADIDASWLFRPQE